MYTPILNPGMSFTQQTESSEWTINHKRGCKPSVSVQVWTDRTGRLLLEAIIPFDIQHVDNNTVKIIFTRPYKGEARLV